MVAMTGKEIAEVSAETNRGIQETRVRVLLLNEWVFVPACAKYFISPPGPPILTPTWLPGASQCIASPTSTWSWVEMELRRSRRCNSPPVTAPTESPAMAQMPATTSVISLKRLKETQKQDWLLSPLVCQEFNFASLNSVQMAVAWHTTMANELITFALRHSR